MFTGIVRHLGKFLVYRIGKKEIIIDAPTVASDMKIGESLAVNGVCLSLTKKERNSLSFNLSEETLEKTTLGKLRRGEELNLEHPVALSTPLSGHLVTGHIDGMGKVFKVIKKADGLRITISLSPDLKPFFIPKGSVAVNGVSLTIAQLTETSFDIELIPITMKHTNLFALKNGTYVNIESDIIGKYVYNWMFKK